MTDSQLDLIDGDPLNQARDLVMILAESVDRRAVMRCRYYPKPGHKWGVADLASVEESLGRFVVGTLTDLGVEFPDGYRLRLNLEGMEFKDDDEDWLEVKIDFAKIFGPRKDAAND